MSSAVPVQLPASSPQRLDAPVVPRLWPPYQAALHPEAAQVEEESLRWLRSTGLGRTPREQAILTHGRFAWLAARAYPRAITAVLRVVTDFVTWAFLFDEHCETSGARDDVDRLCAAVRDHCEGRPVDRREPLLRAFAELRQHVLAAMPPAAAAGFFADLASFVAAVQDQLELVGARPRFEAELRTRELTIGLYPCLHFIAPAAGMELPPEIRVAPDHVARDRHVAQALCWTNDLISIRKELAAGEPHNLILALHAQRGGSLQEAVDEGVRRYYRALTSFAELDARCRTGDPAAIAYSDGLRAWIAALPAWSYASGRYA